MLLLKAAECGAFRLRRGNGARALHAACMVRLSLFFRESREKDVYLICFQKGAVFMLREGKSTAGDFRIPSGCAVSSVFSRSGKRLDGSDIIRSIEIMHDRSNGLGGGFAGYGIYPEYAEQYAFHVF